MNAIIQFFEGIGNAIVSLVDFVIGLISDLVYLVKFTAEILAEIPSYFSWIPQELTVLLLPIFTFVVLFKIMGREG